MRRLLSTTFLAATLPGLVAAQDGPTQPSLWSTILDLDLLTQRILQSGVMALRTQMDIVYGDMSVDLFTGKVTLTELRAWPLPYWDEEGLCEVGIDRITLRSGALDEPDRLKAKLQIIGAAFPSACLPEDMQEPMGLIGVSEIEIPRLTIELDYGVPSSDLLIRMHADVTGLAEANAEAYMTYAWFDGRDDIDDPLPVIFLKDAMLSLENDGLWEAVQPIMPPAFTSDGAGLFIESALRDELQRENRYALGEELQALSAGQTAFLTSLADSWEGFVANPQKIILQTTHESDVYMDFEVIDDDPREIFEALLPQVSLEPINRSETVPLDLVMAATGGTLDGVGDRDRRKLGFALLRGEGAPRNLEAGVQILADMAKAGDGEAAAAVALAIEHSTPDEAYLGALLGGKAGVEGMVGLMNRLEKKLGLAEVQILQQEISRDDPIPDGSLESVAAARAEATMRMSGNGRARSYSWAATWAMIGAAAGDAESADILEEIEERMRLGGEAALETWADTERRAAERATQMWIENDLPFRFGL